jgi:hypothetical protein
LKESRKHQNNNNNNNTNKSSGKNDKFQKRRHSKRRAYESEEEKTSGTLRVSKGGKEHVPVMFWGQFLSIFPPKFGNYWDFLFFKEKKNLLCMVFLGNFLLFFVFLISQN